MSSSSKSDVARVGSLSQQTRIRSVAQSTHLGSLRSGSSTTPRLPNGRPQDPNTAPPDRRYSGPNAPLSSSTNLLTSENLAQHAQATAQFGGHSAIAYNDRVQVIHNTLHQLGLTLPTYAVAELANKFDGMASIERFLAEEGYWIPPATRDGHGSYTSTLGRPGDHRSR